MPSTISETILHSLDQANRSAPTLLGAGDFSLSLEELAAELAGLAGDLRSFGVSRRDRVACVLPPGPEHAIIFLSVASCAVAAPLNPAYHEADFAFYLSDLNASALILPAGLASRARTVALNTGIPILELHQSAPGTIGRRLRLSAGTSLSRPVSDDGMTGSPEDVALVLHTSGTTSRPKQVPLTHANLLASARHIGTTLALGPADRCLNVMPLFHIHGLVAGLLAPLAAGGSVVCTPAFQAGQLPEWLDRWQPTWLTAVPTMHQAALAHYAATPALAFLPRPIPSSLRLIRSSSAALPTTFFAGLEALFGVPVVESYGMTEAAHQMASNPLPPRARKPGSVGLPAGPEITILTADGLPLPIGETGEIAIRGPNVTTGYVRPTPARSPPMAGSAPAIRAISTPMATLR